MFNFSSINLIALTATVEFILVSFSRRRRRAKYSLILTFDYFSFFGAYLSCIQYKCSDNLLIKNIGDTL